MTHGSTTISRILLGALLLIAASMLSCTCHGVTVDGGAVPTPPFPMQDLLLDESAFPQGWQAYAPYEPPGRFGLPIALTYSSHAPGGGIAVQDVYASWNPEEAAEAYADAVSFWFKDDDRHTPWTTPTEVGSCSTTADRLRIGCHVERESETQFCQAVGQYGRYVVRFHTYMSPYMTLTDLERILVAIDERMALYLHKDSY
jgi:hypothetical protein